MHDASSSAKVEKATGTSTVMNTNQWLAQSCQKLALLLGSKKIPIPPRELIDGVGGGDYVGLGQQLFKPMVTIGGLKPDDRVLDVGCGCGRLAVPLTSYLSPKAEYFGFDIVPVAIDWSRQHISSRYQNFRFELADVYSKYYNPNGKFKSVEYRFPYPDNYFDFTFLTSVFTHMLADDMEQYLSEIARTLKPGGRCFISYFLLTPRQKALSNEGVQRFEFKFPRKNCVLHREDLPEAAVAYEETFVRDCFRRHKLTVIEPIHFGHWSTGRKSESIAYQDVVVASK